MANNESESDEEVVCEFFGIKITTKNPNIARVLTTDLGTIMSMDVLAVGDLLAEEPPGEADELCAEDSLTQTVAINERGHKEPGHNEPGHNEPGHNEPGHDA